MAWYRASSEPLLELRRGNDADNDNDNDESPFHGRGFTYGMMDLKSPRATRRGDLIHKAQLFRMLTCRPTVSCEVFEHRAYVMVHLNPVSGTFEDGTEFRTLNPSKLHATLVCAWLEPWGAMANRAARMYGRYSRRARCAPIFGFWRIVAHVERSWGRRVSSIWLGIEPRAEFELHFTHPPWKNSWNFGLDDHFHGSLSMMRDVVERMWESDNVVQFWVRPRVDDRMHVSWW